MKRYIFLFMLISLGYNVRAQNVPYKDLATKLSKTKKFGETKALVMDFYRTQYEALRISDSSLKNKFDNEVEKWNRKFWINEYYVNKDDEVDDRINIDLAGVKAMNMDILQAKAAKVTAPISWTPVGPHTVDDGIGRIDDITFDPQNANIMYAGSPAGGLFKTTNGGANWFPITNFYPFLGVSGIVIDPTNTNIIYVLTGDGDSRNVGLINSYGYRSNGDGVYKTTDGGNSWSRTGSNFSGALGHELIIDPSNPNILIAATDSSAFRTTNGGTTWTKINSFNNNKVFDITFKPGNSEIVYATTPNGFFRSINNGETFTLIANTGISTANRISIGVTPANPNRVVLFSGPMILNTGYEDDLFNGIFTSNDSGLSFTLLTQKPNLFGSYLDKDVREDQSEYDNTIAISPTNENEIYVGGLVVWKSINGGITWEQISSYWDWITTSIYMHPDIHELKYNPLTGKLFCGNDGGVYLYENEDWTYLSSGLTCTQFYQFELSNDEDKMWGGAQDNGIIQEDTPGNINWIKYQNGDGYDVITDHPDRASDGESNDIYYSLNDLIYKDCLLTVADCDITPPGKNTKEFYGNLSMASDDEDHIYAGYKSVVYESYDAGSTWINLPVSGDWDVQVAHSNPNYLYVAGSVGGLRRRILPNTAFQSITPPATLYGGQKISEIHVKKDNANDLVIALAGTVASQKVLGSVDGGATWFNLTLNLPNVPIFSITRDSQNTIYIGTSIGVYYKIANQPAWLPFGTGLPNVPVTKIYATNLPFIPVTTITCSTFGRGIWRASGVNNDCLFTVNVTGTQSGIYNAEAYNNIISSQNNIGAGANVKYSAGSQIKLQNGFRASYGTKFRTYIQPCGNLPASSTLINNTKSSKDTLSKSN